MADSLRTNISNGTVYYKESNEASKHCFKHATENLSQVSKPSANSEPEICEGCSKTVLSYISLIQDMLNGLARKLTKDEDPASCVQCLKQDSQETESTPPAEKIEDNNPKSEILANLNGLANGGCETLPPVSTAVEQKDETQTNQNVEQHITPLVTSAAETTSSESKKPKKVSSRRNSRRISREMKENGNEVFSESSTNRNGWQTDFLYNVSSSIDPKYIPYSQQQKNENPITANLNKRGSSQDDALVNHKENTSLINHSSRSNSSDTSPLTPSSPTLFFANFGSPPTGNSKKSTDHLNFNKTKTGDSGIFDYSATESNCSYHKSETNYFDEPDYSATENTVNLHEVDDSEKSEHSATESRFEADVDDSSKSDYSDAEILERKVDRMSMKPVQCEKIVDQNLEHWNTLHDSFSVCVTGTDRKSSEAFVTICRSNAEALGCLVLGSSLLLSRTSRKLCVLVFDDVDPAFKEPLSFVFHVVQHVRHLNSIDERKLEYLKKTNLEKLCIWGLVQYSKCVFLNPDCLIIRNCDELFQHEELSAVPDIGWPDCFNAGAFVFAPSVHTLSKIVELSQRHGQNNEGDQILLNAYFNSWSSDIGKKLSFIYNLMRNASYTYGPAYQRFGHNVKIVQFLGGSKPWEVKFFTETGQLDGDVNVHPKHARFFSEWINTFKIAVLKLFPQDVYDYAFSQKSVSAEDIGLVLCFPTPCKDFDKISAKPFHILPKRQTVPPFYIAESPPRSAVCDNTSLPAPICCHLSDLNSIEEATEKLINIAHIEQNRKIDTGVQNCKMESETVLTDSPFDRCLPGAIVGDYQGMMAWEQGHIDYEGCDSSENIMNRLSFLIHRSVPPNL